MQNPSKNLKYYAAITMLVQGHFNNVAGQLGGPFSN
jgi:hypothetical protein